MARRRPGWLLSAAISVNSGSTFIAGYGNMSPGNWDVIEIMPDGKFRVLLTSLPETKAQAVAAILNGDE